MIDINWNPSRRELRQFAGLFLVIFGGLGSWLHWHSGVQPWGMILAGVALVVGTVGLAWPAAIRPLFVGWIVAAYPIGWTVSHVLLSAIFFLVLTPIGLILRATGTDPMHRSFDPDARTYWSKREPVREAARYFRQF